MTVERFLHTIDGISTWVGKAAAWLIVVLMTVVCLEVFKRYILNAPTAWIFDLNNMLYGSLFMLCGAYALAQNAHVRGDFKCAAVDVDVHYGTEALRLRVRDNGPGPRADEVSGGHGLAGMRERAAAGRPLRYLVPEPVARFIEEKGLYA